MKLAILYNDDLPVEGLIKNGEEYFDKVLAVPVEGFRYVFSDKNKIMYKGTDLTEFDAVYLRIHDFDLLYVEQVIEVLEDNDTYVQMDPDSGLVASDKFFSMDRLRENQLNVPDSIYALSPEVAIKATEKLGYPVAVKLLSSFGGKGIMRASQEKELKPIMDTLELLEQSICLQKFVDQDSTNARITVIGDETLSTKFVAKDGDWRSSPGSGGRVEEYEASEDVQKSALKAAKALGFELCDVDVIVTPEGKNYTVEVDLIQVTDEKACELTGTDIGDKIMSYIYEKAIEREAGIQE